MGNGGRLKVGHFFFRSFRTKITLFFIAAMVLAGATNIFMISLYALDSQFEQLRDKLMAIAQTSALSIDAAGLTQIPLERSGLESLQYKSIAAEIARIRKANRSVKYIYTLTRTEKPNILKFIVDADAGASVDGGPPTYPGDEYDASGLPEMMKAFDSPTADKKLNKDAWGVFLSGYAPIKDAGGKTVAIIGLDMRAEDVSNVQAEVKRRAAALLLSGIIFAIILGVLISGSVTKQIEELTKGAQRVAKGDLNHRVKVRGADEIAHLGYIFNRMSSDLKTHIEELRHTTAEKERLLSELEIARGIQQSFLPEFAPQIPGIDIAAVSLPARVVGGDFYDFIPLGKDRWGLVIADVSGKGVPAALFMALSRTLMRASASERASPSDAINHANDLIHKDSKANMFVTLFYGILYGPTMKLQYANAGHNPPMLISDLASNVVLLKAQGVPLGIMSDPKTTTEEITLKSGDVVLLYTDGVTEARSNSGEQFEMERLEKVVSGNRALPANEIMQKVRDELIAFVGDQPQFDDITMVVIKAS